jgi:CubicO group peptidase (beta-lactamase class C family)
MRQFLALLVLAFVLGGCSKTEPEATDANRSAAESVELVQPEKLSVALKQFVDSGQLIGTSALVFEKGREAYFGAFGLADREAQQPMKRDTLVRIYSMTKPVTGVALMTLYDEGKFQLDDPIEKYAPEFANLRVYAGNDAAGKPKYETLSRPVTIRDLMRHTAGLTSGNNDTSPVGDLFRAADPMDLNNTLAEMAKKLGSVPLLYQPGTRWLYSPAVDVQAYLVEILSGMPFDQYLQKRIFDPLRMVDTRYTLAEQDRSRLASVYLRSDDGAFTAFTDDNAIRVNEKQWPMHPGGYGLVTTLDDFMRFARMLLNEGELDGARVLSAQAVRLMSTNAMPAEVTDTSWLPSKGTVGFGIDFAVRTAPPANAEEASGAVGEFFWDGYANTLFWVDPKNEIAAVLFTQYVPFGKVPLHKTFRDIIYENDPEASALNKPPASQTPST